MKFEFINSHLNPINNKTLISAIKDEQGKLYVMIGKIEQMNDITEDQAHHSIEMIKEYWANLTEEERAALKEKAQGN